MISKLYGHLNQIRKQLKSCETQMRSHGLRKS